MSKKLLHRTRLRLATTIHQANMVGNPEITIEGKRIVIPKGKTILEVAEANGLQIEAGCRMGVCGADPICMRSGMENLSKSKCSRASVG